MERTLKVHHRGERVAIVSPRTGNVIHVNGKDWTMLTGYAFKPQAFPSVARLTTQQLHSLFVASQSPTDWEVVEQEKNQEIHINFNGKKVLWGS